MSENTQYRLVIDLPYHFFESLHFGNIMRIKAVFFFGVNNNSILKLPCAKYHGSLDVGILHQDSFFIMEACSRCFSSIHINCVLTQRYRVCLDDHIVNQGFSGRSQQNIPFRLWRA